jgi:hypothetical protein
MMIGLAYSSRLLIIKTSTNTFAISQHLSKFSMVWAILLVSSWHSLDLLKYREFDRSVDRLKFRIGIQDSLNNLYALI